MFKFKEPDFRDDGATYLKDNAGKDFWSSRNLFGKVICFPFLLLVLFIVKMMHVTRK